MKKYLVLFFLLASLTSFGQFSNYTNINGRYKWIAGKFDSTFTLPSGTTPSLRTGGGTGPGAMFYRTSDSTIYQYTGTQWVKLRGSLNPTDTAGLWVTNLYKKTGSDSIFYVKGGSHIFAFVDEKGTPGGGGGGKVYYFNGGVNMGSIGGSTMYELGDTANTGAAANFTRATTGTIASFITDPGKPGLLQIPAGSWTVDAWLSETGGGSNSAQIWVEVEKWDGSTITTIATSPIEEITNGSTPDLYTWSVSIPTTSLALTDRIVIQFYITNTNGKTVTLYTQNGYVGEVHTTFTTGIGSLNGLTAPSQFFATGTSGTDFNIASATATHTFNLPTASGTNRGALSSADWTTFNSKVGGSGTTNYLSKWTSSSALGNSLVFDNGTSVGVNTATPNASFSLDINGNARANKLAVNRTSFVGSNVFQVDGISTFSGDTYVVSNASSNNVLTIFSNSLAATFFNIISNGNGAYFNNTTGWDIRQSGLPLVGFSSTLLNFYTSGTEKMRLTNAGRLLIGTTTESTFALDLVGTFRSTGDANINGLTVGRGGGNLDGNTIIGSAALTATNTGGGNTALGYQVFQSATTGYSNTAIGTQSLRVATSGYENTAVGRASLLAMTSGNSNVAIGKDAGLNATTGASNTFIGTGTGAGITTGSFNTIIGAFVTGLSASLSNTIILADGQGNQRLYINNTGLTGLGITSPANALHIDRGNATASYLQFTAGTTTGQTASDGFEVGIDASGNGVLNQQENLPMLFYTNNTERMRIFANGNIAVGRTTDNGEKFQVQGGLSITGAFQCTTIQTGNITSNATLLINNIGANSTNLVIQTTTNSSLNTRFRTTANISSGGDLYQFLDNNTITGIGTGNLNVLLINPTINQTTGTGTIYGYRFNPTNTAVLSTVYSFYADSGTAYFGSSVGVGTTSPNASALLDISSTTKGFLPPRMTNAQMVAIATPAAGLVVYDTTNNKLNVYDGTNWVTLH